MLEQRIYNVIKSLVNIDILVQQGYSAGFILEAIQVACKRQNRQCTLSEMDIIGVIKMLELANSQPFLPNTDVQTINTHSSAIAKEQPRVSPAYAPQPANT